MGKSDRQGLSEATLKIESFSGCRASKSIWWMPRQNVPMKDVAACEKLRGGGKQPLIRRSPNGETQCG